ncbi:hypothetical protein [Clostridium perfringens]|uniref:hypothetical protein n=1 Tax=Clostridium perfringens TaxID=1502 RepID=UPI0022DB52F6|nr:hypothetical protein CIRMBP1286_02469 [Enterococcus cecorum]
MTELNIEILTKADYLHFGSLKIVGFDNLTFRFDSLGKLMADFWDDRDGFHQMRENEQFYQDIQRALQEKLVDIRFSEVHKNRQPEPLNTKEEIEAWLNSEDW